MEVSITITIALIISFITAIIMQSMGKVVIFTNKADKILMVISGVCFAIGYLIIDFTHSVPIVSIIFFIISGICLIFSAINSAQANRGFLFGIIVTILAKAAVIYIITLTIVLWIVIIVLAIIFGGGRRDD